MTWWLASPSWMLLTGGASGHDALDLHVGAADQLECTEPPAKTGGLEGSLAAISIISLVYRADR